MKRTRARGRFIVLEGLDGAGTTTQTERIARALRSQGRRVVTTREPSDGPVGVNIRQALSHRLVRPNGEPLTPATLALLFAADRVDHLESVVKPALLSGAVVLSDRYVLSSLAYQGMQLPLEWVATINAHAVPPDLTVFLDVAPRVAALRRAGRGSKTELYETDSVQKRVARAYETAIAVEERRAPVVRIPGDQDVESITADALGYIQALLDGDNTVSGRPRGRHGG